MKLVHKNFLYTAIITSILTILVLGYFVFMLPSLYVDFMSKKNYNSIVDQQRGYLKDGSYENVSIVNPSCLTVDIPFSEEYFIVTGKNFQANIKPSTDDMRNLITEIKTYVKANLKNIKKGDNKIDKKGLEKKWKEKAEEWRDDFIDQIDFMDQIPLSFKVKVDASFNKNYWEEESTKIHFLSDDTIIIEAGISDGENHYTNYMGVTFNNDHIVMSYLPTMTPQMNEITPIVIHSLPMLIAVIILFALVVSYLYSRGIVDPIIRLAKHTEAIKRSGVVTNAQLPVEGKDEIAELIQTLNELYEELDYNYKALENKNKELKDKNKSQEVFLRSSSHQLKTPIAAALLLVDGMINQIGKYQDVKTYLPEVKKQLLSMRKIVEDILYLSRCEENMTMEKVDLNKLVESQLSWYQITLAEGNYHLVTNYTKESYVTTDSNLFLKILDNLISNAISHSKEGATITISTRANQLEIINSDAHIDEKLMPNIFEPFVSGHGKGHGLGLYIVTYYANILGARVEISNVENGVSTKVTLDRV